MTDLIETGAMTAWEPPAAERADYFQVLGLIRVLTGVATDPRIAIIPGEPPSKARPRSRIQTKRDGTPYVQAYTPAATRNAEKRIAWQLRPLGHHPTGPLALVALFYRSSAHRIDIDNLQKALLDAATIAGVWGDDSHVKAIACTLGIDRAAPRIVAAIAPIPTSQLEIGAA